MDRATFIARFREQYGVSQESAVLAADRAGIVEDVCLDVARRQRMESVREKEEQHEVTKLFRSHGFTVRSTSQARPSKISIGFYDLLVTHKTKPFVFFFDVKRQVGSVWSEAQQEFAADLTRCGIQCFHGDRYEAQRVLDRYAEFSTALAAAHDSRQGEG